MIATAVIEAILHGSSDLGVDADPRATFLWVTDDPALNRQTRNKMLAGSDLLQPARLVVLDNDFLNSTLSAGRVHFLNIQKLSRTSSLARGGRNLRQYSMWEGEVPSRHSPGVTATGSRPAGRTAGGGSRIDEKMVSARFAAGRSGCAPGGRRDAAGEPLEHFSVESDRCL